MPAVRGVPGGRDAYAVAAVEAGMRPLALAVPPAETVVEAKALVRVLAVADTSWMESVYISSRTTGTVAGDIAPVHLIGGIYGNASAAAVAVDIAAEYKSARDGRSELTALHTHAEWAKAAVYTYEAF